LSVRNFGLNGRHHAERGVTLDVHATDGAEACGRSRSTRAQRSPTRRPNRQMLTGFMPSA
jgi:hypothetical protein